jgi:hypothetical protein
MSRDETLAQKMRKLADDGHPRAVELREKADAMETAATGPSKTWDARKVLGAWARARRVWCECTGEPLI